MPDSYNLTYSVDENLWVANPPKLFVMIFKWNIFKLSGTGGNQKSGIVSNLGGWFQTQGGDMSSEQGIAVTIPSTCILAENQASCGSVNIERYNTVG